MYIESMQLKDFRNYEELSLELSPGINIFYGNNAQGKTNILEAMYLCSTTRSHKGSRDRDMIRFGSDQAHLRMEIVRDDIKHRIDMHLRRGRSKGAAVDGIPIRRSAQLLGMVHIICFSPEDLSMIKNGPAERRRFLDMELCQLDSVYLRELSDYNKVLLQRNALLRQISFQYSLIDTLDAWDMQLVRYGSRIIQARREFVDKLNTIIEPVHASLTGGREKLTVIYRPNVEADGLAEAVQEGRQTDLRMKTSTAGPHRDDLAFEADGIDIRKYGSQGQQRTAALSLKLAEIEIVRRLIGEAPVLLLDDVLSELDAGRQNYLMDSIKDIQTMITCTGLDEFVRHRLSIDRIYRINAGKAQRIAQ